MKEILLYGLARGDTERYMEELLASNCKNSNDVEKVKKVAAQHGFHSFRVATYDGSPPNFIKALNI